MPTNHFSYFKPNKQTAYESILDVLEKNPFLSTDKNTVYYKQYPEKWPFMQYHSYIENFYDEAFKSYQNKENRILEIGIDTGGSIALWSKYFNNSEIIGLDINKERFREEYDSRNFNNVEYIYKDAYTKEISDSLGFFDIIIDDGPHTIESQLKAIELYLPKLNVNGILVIEDISDIKHISSLIQAIPEPDKFHLILKDIRHEDNRYDSIIFSVKKIK
jgi:precorrin-6B methylase 2